MISKITAILLTVVVAIIFLVDGRRNKLNLDKCKCHKSDPKARFVQKEGTWYTHRYSRQGWRCGHIHIRNGEVGQQVWAGGHQHDESYERERCNGERCDHYRGGVMYRMGDDKYISTRKDKAKSFEYSTVVSANYSISGCLGIVKCQVNKPNKTRGFIICKEKQVSVQVLADIASLIEQTAPEMPMHEALHHDKCDYPAFRRGVMDKLVNEYYEQPDDGRVRSKIFDDEL